MWVIAIHAVDGSDALEVEMDEVLNELSESVVAGKQVLARDLTQKAIESGIQPEVVLRDALSPAMEEVGRRMAAEELYIPEVLLAARTMSQSMEVLKPLLTESTAKLAGTMVIGTVQGDLHDIGKNLVSMMMRGAGFEVVDLGIDVPPERFVEAIREHKPEIMGMSALLTTTTPALKTTIEAVDKAGLKGSVKILVGGAPVTERYAEKIGADGFSPDAARVVPVAKRLLSELG